MTLALRSTIMCIAAFALSYASSGQELFVFPEVDPNISPFIYEWDNPTAPAINIFVDNPSPNEVNVIFHAILTNSEGIIVAESGLSSVPVITVPQGPSNYTLQEVIPLDAININPDFENLAVTTAQLPEDVYTFCIEVLNAETLQPVSQLACTEFVIQGFQDPINIFPPDGQVVVADEVSDMVFQWLPVTPIPSFGETYEISIFVVAPGQEPQEAVITNEPTLVSQVFFENQIVWPIDLLAPNGDTEYVWTVSALTPDNQAYTIPNGTSEPTTFEILVGGNADCADCTVDQIVFLVNGGFSTEPTISILDNVSFSPVISASCSDPTIEPQFEGYIQVNFISDDGNTQNYTVSVDETVVFNAPGTVTVTFVGQSWCSEGGSTCECVGQNTSTYEVVDPDADDPDGTGEGTGEETDCACNPYYPVNLHIVSNGQSNPVFQNTLATGQSISFDVVPVNPTCQGGPDCEMTITSTVNVSYVDPEGNVIQDGLVDEANPLVLSGPGSLTVNYDVQITCDGQVCEAEGVWQYDFGVEGDVVTEGPGGIDTDDPVEEEDDDDIPGEGHRPPPEDVPNPEDPPEEPPHTPDTLTTACTPISLHSEVGAPIDLGMILDEPGISPYPRAVPLRAEGVDWDYGVLECAGCSGGQSEKKFPTEDRIDLGSYEWRLISGKGSLNSAFQADSIKDVQDEIDSLNQRLVKIDLREKEIAERLETGISADSSKYANKLKAAIEQKAQKDSLITVLTSRIDSVKTLIQQDSTILAQLAQEISVFADSIANREFMIDTTNQALLNLPGEAELNLLSITTQARAELEAKQTSYENLEQEIVDQSVALSENVILLDSLLQLTMADYDLAKNQVAGLAGDILAAETQLFANPISRNFIQRRREWNRKVNMSLNYLPEIQAQAMPVARNEVNHAATAIASAAPAAREELYTAFSVEINAASNILGAMCGDVDPDFLEACLEKKTEAFEATVLYDTAVSMFAQSSLVIDPVLLQNMELWRSQMVALEGQVNALKNQVESASESYEQAVQDFVSTMENLETSKENLLVELEVVQDTLYSRETRYMAAVRKREQHLEQIREPYLAAINVSDNRILYFVLETDELRDSTGVVTKQKQDREALLFEFEEEKKATEEQSQNLGEVIDNIEGILEKLAKEREELQQELEDLENEKEDIEEQLEKLRELMEQLLQPNKFATGPLVYYIPPPLEEVMKDMGTYDQFEEKVKKVDEAKDELSQAYGEKEAVQGKLVKGVDQAANALVKFKNASDQEEALEQKKSDLDVQIATLQNELTLDYQDNQSKLQDILESAENKLDTAVNRKQQYVQDSIYIRGLIEVVKEELELAKAALEEALEIVDQKREVWQTENEDLTISQNALKAANNSLKEKEKALREAEDELARAQHKLSAAVAQEDDAGVISAQSQIANLGSTITNLKGEVEGLLAQLEAASNENKEVDEVYQEALEAFEEAQREFTDKKDVVDSLNCQLVEYNNDLEAALKGVNYWSMVKGKAEDLIDKTNEAREEYQDEVASAVNSDERIKGLQEELAQAEKDLNKAKADKAKAVDEVNKPIEDKEKLIKEAEERLTKAKEDLEKREEELKEFLREQFENVTTKAVIKLKARDEVVDKWRAGDGDAELIREIKYVGDRIPLFENKYATSSLAPQVLASVCNPVYSFKVPGPPVGVQPPQIYASEPRTIALIYEEGEPLWPEWPVIPAEETRDLAKDITFVRHSYTNDGDVIEYQCVGPPECTIGAPIGDGIVDIGTYKWIPEDGRMINLDTDFRYGIWEPDEVPKPKKENKQKLKTKFTGDRIAVDGPVEQENRELIVPGVMIEVTDSLIGVPDTTMQVQARVVMGNHKGLEGEDIEFSCVLEEGQSSGYGFGGDTLLVVPTSGGGYAKTDFSFGDGFAKFKIHVKWKRGGEILEEAEFPATAPILLKFHKVGGSAPDHAWIKAVDLVMAGSQQNESGLDGLTASFPTCLGEEENDNATACARVIRAVAGLLDNEREFVNEEKILFSTETSGVSIVPEEDETEWFGIAHALLEGVKEDQKIQCEAAVEEKYVPLGRPPKAKKKYDSSKIDRFKIGKDDGLFVIILDEPVSRGETVAGTATLGVSGEGLASGVIFPLRQVSLTCLEVVLEESDSEAPLAIAGAVSWKVESGITESIRNFDITLDSLVIRAEMGAGIGGRVDHDKLNNAVGFYAELSPEGDFLGNINNLPEMELLGFTLREGTSVTIDMHSSQGPPISEDFMGVVLHTAALELPDAFSRTEDNQKTTIHAEEFYIGSAGLGGKIAITGSIVDMGYAGFGFKADSIAIEFANHEILGAGFRGQIALPAPMEGKVNTLIAYSSGNFLANISTENPVSIPRLKSTFKLLDGTGVVWKSDEELGEFNLNAVITAKDVGDVAIQGFMINSRAEIKADLITVDETIEFGKGFSLYVNTIAFQATNSETSLAIDGGFGFAAIGIDEVSGKVTVLPGPDVKVEFTGAKIEFNHGPVAFSGHFAYEGTEFRGGFDIGIDKIAPNGITGLIIVGTHQVEDAPSYSYWYAEMSMGVKIPIAQTGLSIIELGGGVGYNYVPPRGSNEGNPVQNNSFSFKAIVGIGTAPGGEVFASRMEMVYVPGQFTLYGKAWLLQMEENMFGEGELTLAWAPEAKLEGYVRMFVALPDADGGVIRFDGKINFLYSAADAYVRSERIEGMFLGAIEGRALVDVNSQFTKLEGGIYYGLNKTFEFGIVDAIVVFDVSAQGNFLYTNSTKTVNANVAFHGAWDVDLDTPLGTADIISGSVDLGLALNASPSSVSVSGTAAVSWDVWIYADSVNVDVGYTAQL